MPVSVEKSPDGLHIQQVKLATTILLAGLIGLTGCGLIPKKVELFQDKVKRVPAYTASQVELQKQAAYQAKTFARETADLAVREGTSTNLATSARATEKLTDAVSESLGPPVHKATLAADPLADKLITARGRLDARVEDFRKDNDENAGKKIEGTGLLQIPYFAYAGGVLALISLVWMVLRAVVTAASAANPAAAIGLGAMNVTGDVAARAVVQVVSGGKKFLEWVYSEVKDSELQKKLVDAFTAAHKGTQDNDVRAVVDKLVK
jgi:hypothetical protein